LLSPEQEPGLGAAREPEPEQEGAGAMARAGLTAERLTRAGAELADEVGFDQVTVSALARRFDVKVASLYSHLRSSQDLRTRIALLALEEMADRAADALAGRSGKDALTAFAGVYRDYAREHPGRYAAAQLRLDPDTAAASAGVRHARMTRALLRGYELTGTDQTHAVRLLGSVFHGYVSLELGGGFSHSAPDTEETWSRVLDALDALLRNWPAPEEPRPAGTS
jgi:AcrR family transcriptional regulator